MQFNAEFLAPLVYAVTRYYGQAPAPARIYEIGTTWFKARGWTLRGEWDRDRQLVACVQLALKEYGIDAGAIDGLVGPQTKHALEIWHDQRGGDDESSTWRDKEDTTDKAAQESEAHAGVHTPASAKFGPWPTESGVPRFYGDVGQHQTMLTLPYPFRVAWDTGTVLKRIQCHQKCASAFEYVFKRTLDHYGLAEIQRLRLDYYGGCLNVRKKRGGTSWSMHAWGIAIDIDPERNQLRWGRDRATLARPEYRPFWQFVSEAGAVGLGPARNYDWMHFQFARLG